MLPRPNFAQDEPPTELVIGGFAYEIDCDYRTWIAVDKKLRDFWTEDGHDIENTIKLYDIEMLVFGGRIEEDAREIMQAIATFWRGYPDIPTNGEYEPKEAVVDFAVDINAIVVAIRDQSGIDLSYKRQEPFHWWLFLLEFRSLAGDHWITRLMQIRGYDGDDKEQRKLKYRFALPVASTPEEREQMEALEKALGG